MDLHCHSSASSLTAETFLNAIHCPECYSEPADVYAQAKRRGMDLVAITDHDTIVGVSTLSGRTDVLVGEELTCWFPEDQCKMHVLVYGITANDHERLQGIARDIYKVAEYLEANRIAHSVAHPVYRQNDRLERWHIERLLLLFKGFECLNGAHSPAHRQAFEPVLEWLSAAEIERLSREHDLAPRWDTPWVKARTGGSDDHGLLNVGRTWTEFPPGTDTPAKVLDCLRAGTCRPGGEAGSSAKLSHTFYSVAVRYYSRHVMSPGMKPNLTTRLLQAIVGEKPAPSRLSIAGSVLKARVAKVCKGVVRPITGLIRRKRAAPASDDERTLPDSSTLLKKLFLSSFRARLGEHPELRAALDAGLPPLGEHDEMMRLMHGVNRDVTRGLADAVMRSVDRASFTGLFDAIAAILAQQFVLSPYYFSLFHQNKERHLLRDLTGRLPLPTGGSLRVGLFTDTLDEVNGVSRFLRDFAAHAERNGHALTLHTSTRSPKFEIANRRNFAPLLTVPLIAYPGMELSLPPILEVLEFADRQQYDAIHVSTPGPMGVLGLIAGTMLRVPVLGTYHTDFPAYADQLTGDHRVAGGMRAYCGWFYKRLAGVFSRSRAYEINLRELGVAEGRMETLSPGVDTEKFNPGRADAGAFAKLGVSARRRLLYCGRLSKEKNLDFLVDVLARLRRLDTALVLVGRGPHEVALRERCAGLGLPAHFVGEQDDGALAALYASADLLVFPSTTDTLGQVVLEAQACGLPALVSTLGGPREQVVAGETGLVLPGDDAGAWASAIGELLDDEPRRGAMGAAAARRMAGRSLAGTFEQFWGRHLAAARGSTADEPEREVAAAV